MRENGYDVYTMSAAGKEIAEVVKEGVPHIVVPFTRKITPIQDLIALVKLIFLLRKIRPDIVHTHTPKAGLLGMIAAWFCRVPVRMHTVAGLPLMEAQGWKRKILLLTERATYATATHIYPNSNGLLKFMVDELKVDQSKTRVIGQGSSNGIDTSFFSRSEEVIASAQQIRQTHQLAPDDFVFAFVGRIVRDKGIGEIVYAMRKVSAAFPSRKIKLILVGPFESDLDPLSQEDFDFLQTSPDVILTGFQKDVRPWIAVADVFVFPSYREGFPNVVMQACCLEVPCIVSDINGCNEIVSHGHTGLIVPPKDKERLFEAMLEMIHDPGRRKAFANLARKHVVANFDQQFVWSQLLHEYQQRLERS